MANTSLAYLAAVATASFSLNPNVIYRSDSYTATDKYDSGGGGGGNFHHRHPWPCRAPLSLFPPSPTVKLTPPPPPPPPYMPPNHHFITDTYPNNPPLHHYSFKYLLLSPSPHPIPHNTPSTTLIHHPLDPNLERRTFDRPNIPPVPPKLCNCCNIGQHGPSWIPPPPLRKRRWFSWGWWWWCQC